jgi:phosphohistidine phosphatase
VASERHLVILRHAKSAWPDGTPDRQRPLNERGRRDAAAAGRWLRDNVGRLDVVVCSPARRARQTWELAAAELPDPPAPRFDEDVYGASPSSLLTLIAALPDDAAAGLLIGHNPALQDLVALLSGQQREMKTSSVAVLAWRGGWADGAAGTALLREHATPRG